RSPYIVWNVYGLPLLPATMLAKFAYHTLLSYHRQPRC
ncbi:general secretion pathway protein GspE, partial [Escherichia coli]